MPRQTKYTPERARRFLDAIKVGSTQRLAASFAGVDEDTIIRWRKRFAEFADAIKEAEGGAVVGWLAKIERAANDGNWQAAAWKLERRYPDEYGKRVQENRTTVTSDVNIRTAFDYKAVIAAIAAGSSDDPDASS